MIQMIIQMIRSMLLKSLTAGMLAGTLLGLVPGVAGAQLMPSWHLGGEDKPRMTQDEYDRQQALDKAYKSATKKIPDKTVNDPWATVRPPAANSPGTPQDKQASKTKPQ
jgi:hypothetical protein